MGIGEAIALTLAEKGMNLALLARSQDKLENVSAKIREKHPSVQVQIFAVDIQNHTEVDGAVERAIASLGPIEVLINNVSHPLLSRDTNGH